MLSVFQKGEKLVSKKDVEERGNKFTFSVKYHTTSIFLEVTGACCFDTGLLCSETAEGSCSCAKYLQLALKSPFFTAQNQELAKKLVVPNLKSYNSCCVDG